MVVPRTNAALPLWSATDILRRRYLNEFSSSVIIILYCYCYFYMTTDLYNNDLCRVTCYGEAPCSDTDTEDLIETN